MTLEQTIPGVLVCVYGTGVLITGESGCGKSELALGLLDRGHLLVADDAVRVMKTTNGLVGRCPENLIGQIEVRGIGILSIDVLFNSKRVMPESDISLIIHLLHPDTRVNWAEWPRLHGHRQTATLLDQPLPSLTLPNNGQRPLPLLVEAAVRVHGEEEVPNG